MSPTQKRYQKWFYGSLMSAGLGLLWAEVIGLLLGKPMVVAFGALIGGVALLALIAAVVFVFDFILPE